MRRSRPGPTGATAPTTRSWLSELAGGEALHGDGLDHVRGRADGRAGIRREHHAAPVGRDGDGASYGRIPVASTIARTASTTGRGPIILPDLWRIRPAMSRRHSRATRRGPTTLGVRSGFGREKRQEAARFGVAYEGPADAPRARRDRGARAQKLDLAMTVQPGIGQSTAAEVNQWRPPDERHLQRRHREVPPLLRLCPDLPRQRHRVAGLWRGAGRRPAITSILECSIYPQGITGQANSNGATPGPGGKTAGGTPGGPSDPTSADGYFAHFGSRMAVR